MSPWALLLLTCQTSAADGAAANVSVTDTLTAEYHVDNGNPQDDDDNYGVVYDRLHLVGGAAGMTASARLDLIGFYQAPSAAYRSDARLERVALEVPVGQLRLSAGDLYQQLGRGIVLSLRKADEVSTDVALRGAEARFAGAQQVARVFAGITNPVNFDPVSQKFLVDVDDFLAGSAYELQPASGLILGAHTLYTQPRERLLDAIDRSYNAGFYAELPALFDFVSLYGEVAAQQRELAGEPAIGLAAYGTADLRFGDSGLLFEGLYLDQFEQKGSRNTALQSRFDYNRPPTLERLQEEVLNNRDAAGGRVRVEHRFSTLDLLLFLNAMVRICDAGNPAELRQGHAYGGGEWYFQDGASRVATSAGYRQEQQSDGMTRKIMVHAEGDYLQSLGSGLALHLSTLNELRRRDDFDYLRGSTIAGLEYSRVGSLSFEFGYDTQNPSPDVSSLFFAGMLGIDLADFVQVRLTAGSRRGGLRCVAGACREFPPFAGVATEIVARL